MADYKIEAVRKGHPRMNKSFSVYRRNEGYKLEMVRYEASSTLNRPKEWFLVAGGLRSEQEAKEAIEHIEKEAQFITK